MSGSHRALQAHLTLALCFAYADLPAIRSLRPQLRQEHLHLALAPGVDRDLDDVRVFLSTDTPTVLVLVRSANLSDARSSEVMALFGRCRSSSHRLAVVEFDPDDPAAFVEAVGDAAASFKARPAPAAPAAIGMMRQDGRRRPTPIGLDGRPCLPAADPDVEDEPSLGTSDSLRDIVGPIPDGVCDALMQSDELEQTERVEPMLDTNADGPDTIPAMRVPTARGEAVRVAPHRRLRAALSGVAIAAAVSAGIAYQLRAAPQNGDAIARRGAAQAASVAPMPDQAAAAVVESDSDRPAPPTGTPPVAKRQVPAVPGVGSVEANDQARVVTALLDAGKIHALDGLLVRRASRSEQPQGEAGRRCARYSIGGLDGWRLPSLDELRDLRRARLLPAGVFWSATKRVDGEAFAMSRDAARPLELPRDEAAAAPLCVRSR